MTTVVKKLSDEARKLTAPDRLELVEQLLDSLNPPDASIDQAWAAEAEDRVAAYRRGEITAVGLSDVLAKYKAS